MTVYAIFFANPNPLADERDFWAFIEWTEFHGRVYALFVDYDQAVAYEKTNRTVSRSLVAQWMLHNPVQPLAA